MKKNQININYKTILSVALICIWSFQICIANPTENFQKATESYKNKDFKTAIMAYEALVAENYVSKELYYNLGNSYFKEKEWGKAVLNYERALQIAPSDEDIQHNLKVVHQELVDDLETVPPFFLSKWWNNLSLLFGSTTWSILSIITIWLAITGLYLWLTGKVRTQRKQGFLAGISLVAISLLFFALGSTRSAKEIDSGEAIIMSKELNLRAAPDPDSKSIVLLHEGTKVQLEDQIGEWYKVRLINGEIGWLPMEQLGKI